MKINRFFALAMIALLAIGAMGAISSRALAGPITSQAAQAADCTVEDDDAAEAAHADADTDNVEEQCGPKDESDANEVAGSDNDNVQEEFESQSETD